MRHIERETIPKLKDHGQQGDNDKTIHNASVLESEKLTFKSE